MLSLTGLVFTGHDCFFTIGAAELTNMEFQEEYCRVVHSWGAFSLIQKFSCMLSEKQHVSRTYSTAIPGDDFRSPEYW